ncbi:DUF927 domain-containing protein [Streptomyces sp. cg2]|uniref:DUF927 domain-containing protein n=1 Tax=Streptomyces sp. cg2 TaxID=3238799 RepID=UPI0034E28CB3
MAHRSQTSQESADVDVPAQRKRRASTVSPLIPAGCRPIAGMKRGWYYHPATRRVLHQQNPEEAPLTIGEVPEVIGRIVHLTDDGQDIRSEYLVRGKRQRRPRILTEDELDRGTWAAKTGGRRPTGNDERHAYARLIREEGDAAPEIAARTYYTDDGDLILPDADAQTLGYRTLRGSEEDAREVWEEIGAWLSMDGQSALVAGAFFAGPVLDSLDMLAHMVSVHGPGQQGKSTILVVCASCFGDLKPRRQMLMTTWNSSKQGITQSLRQRGYLPVALDEHSSSGRTIKESSREISQMVAGAIRAMGTADGSPREADGFWHSVILSSSNEPLKFEGQTEDLASRLQEFSAPFFPDKMVDADGAPAEPGHRGAEHISKRLKRLAKNHGGWPVEWAVRMGLYRAANLAELKRVHLELCARYRPAQGGIAATISELHMAWVVGAHMLGVAIGVPTLGQVAEAEAAARLAEAIEVAAEANVPDHEKLWNALDALRIEASAFPTMEKLPRVSEEGFRKVKGFHDENEWWVVDPVVREAAAQAGVDNVTAALRRLADLKVHIRGEGKDAQRQTPKPLRREFSFVPRRMHCFNTRRAGDLFAPDDVPETGGPTEFPCGPTPGPTPGPTQVGPENGPLTCDGPTGPTGPTLSLFDFSTESGPTPEPTPGPTPAVVAPPPPSEPPTVGVPESVPVYPAPVAAVTDTAFASLVKKASGRTLSATRFGVLGADRLYLPNCEPVPVTLPGTVDDVPALMAAYDLKTLWVHESAALAMGLPTYQERIEINEQRGQEQGHDVVDYGGAQAPTPHPWATPAADSDLVVQGEGLSCWVTLKTDGGKGDRLSLALPLYEDRFDRAEEPGRGGWGGAPTPQELLDALMVYLLSTLHGSADRPQVTPYYLSPNTTAKDYTGDPEKMASAALSPAIRAGAVPPALRNAVKSVLQMQWTRPSQEIDAAERAALWLHQYDKNAAWLAAVGAAKLGVGDPVHHPQGCAYDRGKAGYWRVSEIPGTGLPGLPELRITEAEEGGYWLRTPGMDLLIELHNGWTPDVIEAWVWPTSSRALEPMYDRIRIARKRIIAAADAGRPGARWAKHVNGMLYQSFVGYLNRRRPKTDHITGGVYEKDIFWRPDWNQMILDLALANTYRNLKSFVSSGHRPLSLRVDAATFASNEPDPLLAKPDAMSIGTSGRDWKPELTVPFDQVLPLLDSGQRMPRALKTYKETQAKEGN